MLCPYSEDLRLRVAKAVESGKTTREVSDLYQVGSAGTLCSHYQGTASGQSVDDIEGTAELIGKRTALKHFDPGHG
jgi:hypothetical protein